MATPGAGRLQNDERQGSPRPTDVQRQESGASKRLGSADTLRVQRTAIQSSESVAIRTLKKAATCALIGLVRGYQLCLSPWLGGRCRHLPSCSAYAIEALQAYGPIRGGWLAIRRLGRCHPWGTWGYDPVPERDEKTSRRNS